MKLRFQHWPGTSCVNKFSRFPPLQRCKQFDRHISWSILSPPFRFIFFCFFFYLFRRSFACYCQKVFVLSLYFLLLLVRSKTFNFKAGTEWALVKGFLEEERWRGESCFGRDDAVKSLIHNTVWLGIQLGWERLTAVKAGDVESL